MRTEVEEWMRTVAGILTGQAGRYVGKPFEDLLDKYAYAWEYLYWFTVGYTPTQIANVLRERGPNWVEVHNGKETRETSD